MNDNVIAILKKATVRAKTEGMYDWSRCSTEQQIQQVQMFIGIIILEIEMSEFVSDLDKEAIEIVRKMSYKEWKTNWEEFEKVYDKIPSPTDEFIKSKILEKIK
jgi:hypothetical protein